MILNLTRMILTFIPYFSPELLIFVAIYLYSQGNLSFILQVSITYQVLYLVLFLLIVFYVPFIIISYWRKIENGLPYFLSYCFNNFYLCTQICAIYIANFILDKNLMLKDLSVFSQYRYILISFFSIIAVFFLIYFYFFNKKKPQFFSFIFYPYSKMHISNYLSSWENSFTGDLCLNITNLLASNKWFVAFYFFTDFCIHYLYRFILLSLFINFCFFNGLLNNLLYFLPLTLFIWLFKFLFFYYYQYFINNRDYIINMLIVTCNKPLLDYELHLIYAQRKISDFSFTLSPIAAQYNLKTADLPHLASCWFQLTNIDLLFLRYYAFFKPIPLIIFLCYLFCYYFIVYNFFFLTTFSFEYILLYFPFFQVTTVNISFLHCGFPWSSFGFPLRRPLIPTTIITRHPPWSAHFFCAHREKEQGTLRDITQGVYCPGHLLGGEIKDKVFYAEGYFTHNPINTSRGWWVDSKNVSTDPNAKQGPQWFVPFDEVIEIPCHYLKSAATGTMYNLRNNTPMLDSIYRAIKRVRGDNTE